MDRFKIVARLGIKLLSNGNILRDEKMVTAYLGSVDGCVAWVIENQPYVTLNVWDSKAGRDIANEILTLCGNDKVTFSRSRYLGLNKRDELYAT